MDWFAKEFEIEMQEEWYLTEFQDYERWGGGGLLHQVQNSLINLWATIYPQYIWYPWYCSQTPKGYWDDRANRKLYFDWAAEQLGVEIAADWYSIRVTLYTLHTTFSHILVRTFACPWRQSTCTLQ